MGMMRTVMFSLVGLFACASAACAGVIGIDVANIANVYTGPGVLDTSSRTWTLRETSGNTFTLDGQTITVTFSAGFTEGGANATINLFDDYKFITAGTPSVTLTGLDLTKTYNLVLYGAQNFLGGRGTTFDPTQPNLASLQTSGNQQSSFVSGTNYVRYDNITPDNSLLDARIQFTVGIGPDGGVGILNGFELQEVPEPSSIAMLLFGSIGLWLMRRR